MKVYCIKGSEGAPGYLKQSMKLPKSWSSKPLLEVLKLFCETYNKKFPDAPIDAEAWHLEKPLGSTLFPDDQVGAALTEYCDVFCVEGAVKYKGPPPGTAAALEEQEALERAREAEEAAKRTAEEDAALAAAGKLKDQWSIKVRCVSLDRGGMDVKSQYKVGDVVSVTIEPHATVGMLSNRIGLMVGCHPQGRKRVRSWPTSKAPSYLGRFPLVSADSWTSDHLSERSRSVHAVPGTRARETSTLKRR